VLVLVARKVAPPSATDLDGLISAEEVIPRGSVTPLLLMPSLTVQFRSLYQRSGRGEREHVAGLIERAAKLSHFQRRLVV
jgi:hypothetical protein